MSQSAHDARLLLLLGAAAALVASLLVLIASFQFVEAWPVLKRVGPTPFILDQSWHPTEGLFGMMPMLAASMFVAAGAILLAAPLGIASALFYRFYAPLAMANTYRWAIVLLAGVPSVVLGLWGLTVVAPLIAALRPPGASLLAGVLTLSLMLVPTVALTTEAALAAVPQSLWSGAAALGLSREAAILHVGLPVARASVATGVLLAAARALGETMVVLMVAGNVVQMPTSLFDPVRTLTANIALEMAYATGDHRASLFVSGLILTAIVLALAMAAARLSTEQVRVQ